MARSVCNFNEACSTVSGKLFLGVLLNIALSRVYERELTLLILDVYFRQVFISVGNKTWFQISCEFIGCKISECIEIKAAGYVKEMDIGIQNCI